jgi:hypothetical protein
VIKIENQKESFLDLFQHYPVFTLFIEYAILHVDYVLYVNRLNHPNLIMMHVPPAFIFAGSPDDNEIEDILRIMNKGAWIVSPNVTFDQWLEKIYGSCMQSHPRILFDEGSLDVNHLKRYIKPLPKELSIVPIEEKHLVNGMIKEEIINRFFINTSLMTHGFGFALVNEEDVVHGFALTNYPLASTHEIEVSYRVGYESFQKYRNQGIGTTLVCTFLIEAIQRGYKPIWDAANEVSAHIARKLGYIDKYQWKMHHIIEQKTKK